MRPHLVSARARAGMACAAVVYALGAFAGLAGAAPPVMQTWSEKVLTRIVTPNDTLRVIATVRCGGSEHAGSCGPPTVRIVDRLGRTTYADSLPPTLNPGGATGLGIEVFASPAGWNHWQGIELTARETGTDRTVSRYLALRGDQLAPVTSWCRAPYREPGGAEIRFCQAMSHFVVFVPARVRFDRKEGGIELVPPRDPGGSELAALDISGAANHERLYYPELGDTVFSIRLYRAARGAESDLVTVTPSSQVEFGRAFAEVRLATGKPPLREQWPDVRLGRLQVTVEGRQGFVEAADFPALGLTEAVVDPWSTAGSAPPRRRFDRILTRFPVPGDTLCVVATMFYPRRGDVWPQTTELIRIVNRRGDVQYADSMPPSLDPSGAIESLAEFIVEPIRWSEGPGLRLTWESAPSDPSDPGSCRYFAPRGGRLFPVTPWCSACRGPEKGDVVFSDTWEGWFGVRVPARVRLERPEAGLELVPTRDAAHGGLAVLEICDVDTMPRKFFDQEQRDPLQGPGARLSVQLYRSPTGYAADSVTVRPSSRVQLGRLYADVSLESWEGAPAGQSIQVLVRRLEVTIDGRHGFVEVRDFPAVGLQEAD